MFIKLQIIYLNPESNGDVIFVTSFEYNSPKITPCTLYEKLA